MAEKERNVKRSYKASVYLIALSSNSIPDNTPEIRCCLKNCYMKDHKLFHAIMESKQKRYFISSDLLAIIFKMKILTEENSFYNK